MNRRSFIVSALALASVSACPIIARTKPPNRTRWNVSQSEGFDAIAFLGALSGRAIYRRYYAADADAFAPRLPAEVRADIPKLFDEAEKSSFGLLWPVLANIVSGAGVTTLDSVIAALADPERRIRPSDLNNPSRDDADWLWLEAHAARLKRVFAAMGDAGFAAFRQERIGTAMDARITEVMHGLADYDVVRWQEKLTGRTFEPRIDIVLLAFSKPHGVRVQGQTFLQAADYDIATTVRIAAHEMLHPPFPMDGASARSALAILGEDPLITRIVRDHDPKWGYTTLDGLLNEDMAQALDQMISEALGVARNPADRWRRADDGMHVLAAGLYALLRQDGWAEKGGSIETWLEAATKAGRLAPATLHPAAARVLERPVDALWPLPAQTD